MEFHLLLIHMQGSFQAVLLGSTLMEWYEYDFLNVLSRLQMLSSAVLRK